MKFQLNKRVSEDALLARSAAVRYDREVAGITTPEALLVLTGREDQSLVTSAVLYLQNKPAGTTISFTTTAGVVDMTLDDLLPFSLMIGDHVQSCRNLQAAVDAKIRSGEICTLAQVDDQYTST